MIVMAYYHGDGYHGDYHSDGNAYITMVVYIAVETYITMVTQCIYIDYSVERYRHFIHSTVILL